MKAGTAMFTKPRRGFTLIEVTLSVAMASVLGVLCYTAFTSIMRVVTADQSILTMDRAADNALNRMADSLRTAILPITYESGSGKLHEALNDRITGFARYGKIWRNALQMGTDCVAFTTPADFGGDNDFLDTNMMLELGIVLPDGTHVPAGEYAIDEEKDENRLTATGSLNPFLAELSPRGDLDLSTSRTQIDLAEKRFERVFSFPGSMDAGYGVIRFVPLYIDNSPYVVEESELGYDLNGDGDTVDTFALGGMQMIYPNVIRDYPSGSYIRRGDPIVIPLTSASVLLQLNQNDDGWTPIFKLVSFRDPNKSANLETFDESQSSGDYALLIRLLLCDNQTQSGNPQVFGRNRIQAITRQYETIVKLRNIITH